MRAHRRGGPWAACLLLALLAPGPGAAARAAEPATLERGEYVLHAAGCLSCHTHFDADGEPLAGGRPLSSRFGTFYAPNITPDPEHGIGGWSRDDFARALTRGIAPDGRRYYPAFPYTAYTGMDAGDIDALWAYLSREAAPVAAANVDHELVWYAAIPYAMRVWQWLFFEPGASPRDPERSAAWNRGAYLADTLAHCGACHTPRGLLGAPVEALRYAGTEAGPHGDPVPNITPHRETGIGRWSVDDLAFFLEIGMTPGGDFTGGSMADVIDHGTGHMSGEDRRAMAQYVLSLPPVANRVGGDGGEEAEPRGEFE